MKRILLKLIRKLGYDIIRYNYEPGYLSRELLIEKYKSLINEVNSLYQERILPEFHEGNYMRVSLMSKLLGTQISEAIYIINFLNKATFVKGDVCEFGIAQGSTSTLIANEISQTSKNLWLFDSFEGLPKPTEKDLLKDDICNLGSIAAYQGTMAFNVNMVLERLSEIAFPLDRVKIVPGFIEKTIKHPNLPNCISFAYIDFDFYEPIKIALEYLENNLSIGGYIIVDDYDFFSTGAKTAVDEFMNNRNDRFSFSLPCKAAGHFCILERTR